ncbi:Multiple ankyrin repeats single kh domain [Mycena kentingensis (nom. inval.)]|nr:Multiple ankyrin repeats single kh domain [Mycena kentingensis (nom. inval.)]
MACPNTDISGVGVRVATYLQNLLSFVPAFAAILDDHKISAVEAEFIESQSTNILITAFALLLSAIAQTRQAAGSLDNYHLALVLNLSWMNNTNCFVYLLVRLHRAGVVGSGVAAGAGWKGIVRRWKQRGLFDRPVLIGTLHLSLMGAVGLWLWADPRNFGNSPSCGGNPTLSLFGTPISLMSARLRLASLVVYGLLALPVANVAIPASLLLIPRLIFSAARHTVFAGQIWDRLSYRTKYRLSDIFGPERRMRETFLEPLERETAAARARSVRENVSLTALVSALLLLLSLNVIFIIDTELAIRQNEPGQEGADQVWTLGQILPMLLVVLPLYSLCTYLWRTVLWRLRPHSDLAKAMTGLRHWQEGQDWLEVFRWGLIVQDTPVPGLDRRWLFKAIRADQPLVVQFLVEQIEWVDASDENGIKAWTLTIALDHKVIYRILEEHAIKRGNQHRLTDVIADQKQIKLLLGAAGPGGIWGPGSLLRKMVISFSNENGWTALHYAAEWDDLEISTRLVEAGARIDATAYWSQDTPLQLAASRGYADLVQFLVVKKKANVNRPNYFGQTPLHRAVDDGSAECARILVENGANVEYRDKNGHTPLCNAARWGNWDCIRLLVGYGAKIDEQVIEVARSGHNSKVRETETLELLHSLRNKDPAAIHGVASA